VGRCCKWLLRFGVYRPQEPQPATVGRGANGRVISGPVAADWEQRRAHSLSWNAYTAEYGHACFEERFRRPTDTFVQDFVPLRGAAMGGWAVPCGLVLLGQPRLENVRPGYGADGIRGVALRSSPLVS
jgi:hypothetical protein